jgi:hypothetical protein
MSSNVNPCTEAGTTTRTSKRRTRPHARRLALAAMLVTVVGAVGASVVGASSGSQTGTLALDATLRMTTSLGPCPPGTPAGVECPLRQGSGFVRGLGVVAETYAYLFQIGAEGCSSGDYKALATTARLRVSGKGDIEVAVDEGPGCRPTGTFNFSRPFTVTGGTGAFVGASGSGTLTHQASFGGSGLAEGIDTWQGSIVAPATSSTLRPRRSSGRCRGRFVFRGRPEAPGCATS